jgi:hypothetical protein
MDSHGFSWILMDSHGFSWILMDSHGFSWILMQRAHAGRHRSARSRIAARSVSTHEKRLFHSLAINSVSLITDELALVSFAHSRLDFVHERRILGSIYDLIDGREASV